MVATLNRPKISPQKGKRCLFFAFAIFLCWILVVSNAEISEEEKQRNEKAELDRAERDKTTEPSDYATGDINAPYVPDLDVIDLTSKNFASNLGIGDGNVWLIEFYTPTCSHCVKFAATYKELAKTLHSSEKDKVKVARVNCNVEKALMTRFGIKAFPSFYLVSGWDVYEFTGNRGLATLRDFATGGYKKSRPIPFVESPMGPMGLLQGTLIFLGTRAIGVLDTMQERFGISPIVSGVIISMTGVCCGMISIVLLTVLSTVKGSEKTD